MNRLSGKVAIVTGAGSGLGRADAEALVREGAKVTITDIDEVAGRALEAALNAVSPGSALFLRQDVRDEQRWHEVVAATVQRFGGVHVLVNNAGITIVATPETTTLEQFRFANAVMNEGVFLGCKAVIQPMRASGGGSIINMCSTASHLGFPVYFAYSAAKGAVRSMTKAIAVHCQQQGYNIRCNSVHPGAIDTPMIDRSFAELGVEKTAFAGTPTGLGRPEDVASMIVYLASDESRFVNGAELLIDNALIVQ
jgi:3(or 17)beta-hydroxysteroid dehydrogenase